MKLVLLKQNVAKEESGQKCQNDQLARCCSQLKIEKLHVGSVNQIKNIPGSFGS
jgi:hypothetical protein